MKNKSILLLVIFTLIYSQRSFSQIDVNITDIKTRKTVAFSEIHDVYKLNKNVPTLVITWSGKWCYPCINLINRYNNSDLSMLNVITINVDTEDNLEDVLDDGHHLNWKNTLNFHANLGEDETGFDNVFNISSAPLILYIDKGAISDAVVSYSLYPYRLLEAGRIKDVRFIWNSEQDLNSMAWTRYLSEDDPAKLKEAIAWVDRSIALYQNYNNTDTYAALLFKTGEYTKALKAAKDAIELAKQGGDNYDTTTDLINKIIEKL
jgi:tetratricopeptide (TPR) repeat protein